MLREHPLEHLSRRLLALHAVQADVPPELHRHAELRLQHPQLVLERDHERRQLARSLRLPLTLSVRRVGRVRGVHERHATGAVQAYLAEHRVRERCETVPDIGEDLGERGGVGQVGEEAVECADQVGFGRRVRREEEGPIVCLFRGDGLQGDPVREPGVVACRSASMHMLRVE